MKTIRVTLPRAWEELTPDQLAYVYSVLAQGRSMEQVKALVLFRIGKWEQDNGKTLTLSDVADLDVHLLADALRHLEWMDEPANPPVRLAEIEGHACETDALWHQVSFGTYLLLENLWQSYLRNPAEMRPIALMNDYLYGAPLDSPLAVYNTTSWMASLKARFEQNWPDLFKPVPHAGGSEVPDMVEVMNSELRALTGGDVTKESAVRAVGCWRALEELNAKVKESKQYGEHRRT